LTLRAPFLKLDVVAVNGQAPQERGTPMRRQIINLKAARALGLDLPPALIGPRQRVIE
jgi:hypothetical protein